MSRGNRPLSGSRDLTRTVRAYRMVAAVTAQTEVLSPCGHEVPRFDLTPDFETLKAQLGPRFPRTRLCPRCTTSPTHVALARIRHTDHPYALQIASDWGSMTRGERDAALPLLRAVLDAGAPDPAQWMTLTPEERLQVAMIGETVAAGLGLTFRELMGLRAQPAPAITPAGLRRLQASPDDKRQRASAREEDAFRRDKARRSR